MENLWKVNEVAAAVQVSVQTIYRYVMNNEIPFIKLSGAVRFEPSAISRWLESKKAGLTVSQSESGLFNETMTGNTESQQKTDTQENNEVDV